jgi:hypothetical protein
MARSKGNTKKIRYFLEISAPFSQKLTRKGPTTILPGPKSDRVLAEHRQNYALESPWQSVAGRLTP